jgi:hypothetical protein
MKVSKEEVELKLRVRAGREVIEKAMINLKTEEHCPNDAEWLFILSSIQSDIAAQLMNRVEPH